MILMPNECKTLFQVPRGAHVLDKCIFDVAFDHILFERNKIEHVRIFDRLQGKFSFGGGEFRFKVHDLLHQHLMFVEFDLDLIHENVSRPTVPERFTGASNRNSRVFYFIEQGDTTSKTICQEDRDKMFRSISQQSAPILIRRAHIFLYLISLRHLPFFSSY